MKRRIITQIGSLPFTNIEDAVNYSLQHDIPFLPELPLIMGDSMTEYINNPGNLSCLELFKKHSYDIVKVQAAGPASMLIDPSNSINDESEAVEVTYNHLYGILDGLDSKQTIIFLDEPALGYVGFDYESLWSMIFSTFASERPILRGIHVCGNMDWDKLFSSPELDIISFDASSYDIMLSSNYRNGKRIAWGVTSKDDVKDFQEGDLITLPCGMSPIKYNVDDCYPVLDKLKDIAKNYIK